MATVVLRKKPEIYPDWMQGEPQLPMQPPGSSVASTLFGEAINQLSKKVPQSLGIAAAAIPIIAGLFVGGKSAFGKSSQGTRLRQLAVDMEKAGESEEAIWKATGWGRMPGSKKGEWVSEIPDQTTIYSQHLPTDDGDYVQFKPVSHMSAVVKNSPASQQYPSSFLDMKFKPLKEGSGYSGEYDPLSNTMSIAEGHIDDVINTHTHEAAHFAQRQEGFARGANPTEFIPSDYMEAQSMIDMLRNKRSEMIESQRIHNKSPKGLGKIQRAIDRIDEVLYEDPNRQYRDTAGEAMARLQESRKEFDSRMIREHYPFNPATFYNSTGSRVEDLIYRYGSQRDPRNNPKYMDLIKSKGWGKK